MAAPTSSSQTVQNLQGQFEKQTPLQYQNIGTSQTDKVLGAQGGVVGDYISHLIIVVATAAQSAVDLQDGSDSSFNVFPASPGPGIGTYTIPLGIASRTGAWSVTTGSGVTVVAVGQFT